MSCGTKIQGRLYSYSERQELADKLEDEGESTIARAVRRDECLSDYDLRRAKNALDRQGLSRHFDFKETPCACHTDDDEYGY